jgi:hypothetical protein
MILDFLHIGWSNFICDRSSRLATKSQAEKTDYGKKKCPLCEASQKGLFLESSQRQMETISLPPRSYLFPSLSTISKSPSTLN